MSIQVKPFIGPQPFEETDSYFFYGRDREVEEILALILSSSISLVYAKSGLGKTSIFNAKIIPELQKGQYNFEILPVIRFTTINTINDIRTKHSDISNIYIFNTLREIIEKSKFKELENESLLKENLEKRNFVDFLKEYKIKQKEAIDQYYVKLKILIFDQFEEFFNIYINNRFEQQKNFFYQIKDAINIDPNLRVVFIMREEFIAYLDTFSHIFPDGFRRKFRLEPLREKSAINAVEKPLIQALLLEPRLKDIIDEKDMKKIANEVVRNLLKTHVQVYGGKTEMIIGEFVEPVLLQVVCLKLWEKDILSGKIQNELASIEFGDVDNALIDFYDDAINASKENTKTTEYAIREWCEKKLITSAGTRNLVYQDVEDTGGISNRVIDGLQNKYLIRAEDRAGGKWFELTHDRLINPIKESNKKWMDKKQKSKKKFRIKVFVPFIIFSIIGISLYLSNLQADYQNESEQKQNQINQLTSEIQQRDELIKQLASGNDIRIGALLGLSGISSERGKTQKAAIEEAVNDVNKYFSSLKINKKVVLYVEDTERKPYVAVAKLKKLADRNIRIIIGPPTSSELNATMKYIDENKIDILLISQSSTSPSLSKPDNIFRFVPTDINEGKEVATKMWNDGIRVVVPLLRSDVYGNDLYNAMKINFEKLGGNISTKVVKYNPHVGKFAGSLHRINFIMWNQELKSLSSAVSDATNFFAPDSIGVYIISYGEIVPILIQAQSYNNLKTVKWYGSDGTAKNEHLVKHNKAAEFADTTNFTNPLMALNEKNVKFQSLEKDTNLKDLNLYDAIAYDALWIAALTENISGNMTFVNLKDNFNKIIHTYEGASGKIKLDLNGDRFGIYDFWEVMENPVIKGYEWIIFS